MTGCGKHGKTIKLFSHPSHRPWKSLRDSHITHGHDDEDENLSTNAKPNWKNDLTQSGGF